MHAPLSQPVVRIVQGDVRVLLKKLRSDYINCVVTSPPYWGLRDYGTAQWEGGDPGCDHRQGRPGSGRADGIVDERFQRNRDGAGAFKNECRCGARRIDSQIGLEPTLAEYIETMRGVFREVWRVLRKDGTLWLNMGDSYASGEIGRHDALSAVNGNAGITYKSLGESQNNKRQQARLSSGLKPKDLCGVPWRVAFALQSDGWYLRSDIIWAKPNPMPESVTDRPTKAHEYVFLMSKSERYYYDAKAIAEQSINSGRIINYDGTQKNCTAGDAVNDRATLISRPVVVGPSRNRRTIWQIATAPFPEAHFATFPPKLVEPCILAGCPVPGIVLDPFAGAGTVGLVANQLGRHALLFELNPAYCEMAHRRIPAIDKCLIMDQNS